MKKYISLIVLALSMILSGCAGFDLHFNKYAEQTTHHG